MIKRLLTKTFIKQLNKGKIIVLQGPRQVGKSTLLNQLKTSYELPVLWWNGDESDIRNMLINPTSTLLKNLIGSAKTLVIDEAQRIENIGLCLKLIADNIKGVQVIATGSSSFELANKIKEPLTGRAWHYFLFPFSFTEMVGYSNQLTERRLLEQRLIFGYYPEVVLNPTNAQNSLKALSDSYLYKDILMWQRIQKADRLEKLLQALAFQVGSEVSYHELGQICGLDSETVEKYLDLLEKAFVIFHLNSFSRNLRNELKKSRKFYFFDNGIRNAIINQFNPLNLRQDVGALWENFLVSERKKYLHYNQKIVNQYFWRTTMGQEIDYLEEENGQLYAWEFKWQKTNYRFTKTFLKAYPNVKTAVINKDNFLSFIGA